MEGRSSKYSSRPRMVAMGEILWDGASVLVQPYGKEWSVRRKLLHLALSPKPLRLYKPTQEAEASRLAFQLAQNPTDWEKLLERFTSSIVFCVAYGHRIDSLEDQYVKLANDAATATVRAGSPGSMLVDFFPVCEWSAASPWVFSFCALFLALTPSAH